MKTIKELEKEIEWVEEIQSIQHTLKMKDWDIWINKRNRIKETKAKLQTLKEVLKLIDEYDKAFTLEFIKHYPKGVKRGLNKLKQKIEGKK